MPTERISIPSKGTAFAGGLVAAAAIAGEAAQPSIITGDEIMSASAVSDPSPLSSVPDVSVCDTQTICEIPDLDEIKWNRTHQTRFDVLVDKEAFEKISPAEIQELEQLDSLRRTKLAPRTGEEIVAEYRARRETERVLKALRRYVQFFNAKS